MDITSFFTILGASMLPVMEVKAAIPIGVLSLGLPLWEVFLVAVLGSCIPSPFILFFIRKILHICQNSRFRLFRKVAGIIIRKIEKNQEKIKKYGYLALFIFVAIPLPGTGVWTGSILAGMLNLRIKYSLPAIVAGNIVASLCMIFLTHSINIVF